MSFNTNPTKPPIEIVLSTKPKPPVHPPLIFNGVLVKERAAVGAVLRNSCSFLPALWFLQISPRIYQEQQNS